MGVRAEKIKNKKFLSISLLQKLFLNDYIPIFKKFLQGYHCF